jgi:hypothetical protein
MVALCPPLNVEDEVGEVMKTVAKAEETRVERRTTLANILSEKRLFRGGETKLLSLE